MSFGFCPSSPCDVTAQCIFLCTTASCPYLIAVNVAWRSIVLHTVQDLRHRWENVLAQEFSLDWLTGPRGDPIFTSPRQLKVIDTLCSGTRQPDATPWLRLQIYLYHYCAQHGTGGPIFCPSSSPCLHNILKICVRQANLNYWWCFELRFEFFRGAAPIMTHWLHHTMFDPQDSVFLPAELSVRQGSVSCSVAEVLHALCLTVERYYGLDKRKPLCGPL